MNFYLTDDNGDYSIDADNAYIPDFFIGFLYNSREKLSFSLHELFKLNLYENGNVENVSALQDEISHLLNMHNHTCFSAYPYMIDEFRKLNKYLTIAIKEGRIIAVLGD